jgi:hypothetical protein
VILLLLDALRVGCRADSCGIPAHTHGEEVFEPVRSDNLDGLAFPRRETDRGSVFGPRGHGFVKRGERRDRMAKVTLKPEMNRGLIRGFPRDAGKGSKKACLHLVFGFFVQAIGVEVGKVDIRKHRWRVVSVQSIPNGVSNSTCSNAPRVKSQRRSGFKRLHEPRRCAGDADEFLREGLQLGILRRLTFELTCERRHDVTGRESTMPTAGCSGQARHAVATQVERVVRHRRL